MQTTSMSTLGKMDLISTVTSMSTLGEMDLISKNNAIYIDVDFWENGFNQHKQCKLQRGRLLGKWII